MNDLKFSKLINYQIQDLSEAIKKAYEARDITSTAKSDFKAIHEGESFYLLGKDAASYKLVMLMSTLCEAKNLYPSNNKMGIILLSN